MVAADVLAAEHPDFAVHDAPGLVEPLFEIDRVALGLKAGEKIGFEWLDVGQVPGGELLDQVGLGDRASHQPSALSGGEQQRVAIARALANEPLVVLADEPTGNLDSAATTDVLRLFDQLHANGQTLVVVTHDERIAATADRLISMRDGRFVDETKLTGGTERALSVMTGFEG